MSEDVEARYKDVKVFLETIPRSCSGVTQASDISQDFKAEKSHEDYQVLWKSGFGTTST